jgi:S1-C subfamily serine protease
LFSPSSRNDGATAPSVPQAHDLGFDQEPIITNDHEKRMKVTRVDPGTLAQKGGLHPGDIIHSINGYVTEVPGNLPWIIANAAPDRVLTMTVRNANNTNEHTVIIPVGLAVASGR